MATNRSRRLRKKLYLDEFKVLGFAFSCRLDLMTQDEFDPIIDEFLGYIEDRNLVMGGGADTKTFDGFIVPERRYDSATEEDRTAVEQWLSNHRSCFDVIVGPLIDANQPENSD